MLTYVINASVNDTLYTTIIYSINFEVYNYNQSGIIKYSWLVFWLQKKKCCNGWFVTQTRVHRALHVACRILLISFLHLHSWSGYQSICWVGLQMVKEIWVLVQSILCAAANVEYLVLHLEHMFNHHSDYILYKYHWICSYVCILSLPSFYVHSCIEHIHIYMYIYIYSASCNIDIIIYIHKLYI